LTNLPLYGKIAALKKPFRKWNKEVFGNIEGRILALEKETEVLDLWAVTSTSKPYDGARIPV